MCLSSLKLLNSGMLIYLIMSNRREITDEEIYNLSRLLPDGKYKRLGGVLGFPYNYVEQILKKRLNDTTAAFEEVLHEWRNKGRSIEDLDAALMKADLGDFVPKYKN